MDFLSPLAVADLRALGIPEPWHYGMADRVRFYEIDSLGHVNNVAYLRWFETIRVRWFGDIGLRGRDDVHSVLRAQTGEYFAPMFLDDAYVVVTRGVTIGRTSLTKEYGVFSGGTLRARGTAVIVTTDPGGARKVPIPDDVRARLRQTGATDATPAA